jgi:hypothetical protein
MRPSQLAILALMLLFLNTFLVTGQDPSPGTDAGMRDPLIPLIDENGKLRENFEKPSAENINTNIVLTGISQINGVFYALLDGELLKEGDMIKELMIQKIQSDKVILSFKDKTFEIALEPEKEQ